MYNTTAPRQTLPACMLVNDRGRDESLHTEICQRPLLMGTVATLRVHGMGGSSLDRWRFVPELLGGGIARV